MAFDIADNKPHQASLLPLSIGAMGVVYGDIGTSPIYTLKECFYGSHAIPLNTVNLLGVLSLIFWSLTFVVTLKYLTFVMRADNHGEGGIFSLLALLNTQSKDKWSARSKQMIIVAALVGAALLYGDGVITPAISVLSAIEGLEFITVSAKPFVLPLTCFVLFSLFAVQKYGTTLIGRVFGPIMLLWFASLALMGGYQIIQNPDVLVAINPFYAIYFFQHHFQAAFFVLGAVVLCITGGEALYADMGHFGVKAIRLSWFSLVFPSLILNYFGQGALLLNQKSSHPFYSMAPDSLRVGLVILATFATIIASQALISGVFSLTRQAMQLGYLNRLQIVHTSSETEGQIYIPVVNYLMMIACLLIVLMFQESGRLAAAYGIAVTANMVLTSFLFFFVLTKLWKWPLKLAIPLISLFLVFDLIYFASNLVKFADGGWLPSFLAAALCLLFFTWKDGRTLLSQRIGNTVLPLFLDSSGDASVVPQPGTSHLYLPKQVLKVRDIPIDFLSQDIINDVLRVPGTAIFMAISDHQVPIVLIHHLKLNHVLHEQVVMLSVKSENKPFVADEDAVIIKSLSSGVYLVSISCGFMQSPDVPDLLAKIDVFGQSILPETSTYFLGHQTLLVNEVSKDLARWRKQLFIFMTRNAWSAAQFFRLPTDRVIEMGIYIEL